MSRESSRYNKLESMLQGGSSEPHLRLEYLSNITNNFSDEQLLGEGGFGTVYKGVLQNGETIAVKKFKLSIPGVQDRQFENEARHLMRLKHPNVVLLVGWCSETQYIPMEYNGTYICAEKIERLLCLEYMPKGNLCGYLSDASSGLDWDTRFKIIEGICYGLRYLHEQWQPNIPIVHMDLKPANILLDNNLVPKISDFGLSRLFSEEKTWTCTRSLIGTLGYMSPEYISRGLVSTKSDIFSLGVIIIEIVTGRRDYPDETGTSSKEFVEMVLYNWTRRNWMESFVVNAQLEVDYQQIRRCSQITRCIQIGLDCVKFDRYKRPTISQIIRRLDGLGSDLIISNIKEASNIASRKLHRPQAKLGPFKRTLLPCQELQSGKGYKTPGFCRAVTFIALHQREKKTALQRIRVPAAPPPPGMVITTRDTYFLWELRKYVLLQATLAASITYSVMLSPPGGVWPDNDSSSTAARLAGDPVLQVTYTIRYGVFFYCNATAFVASLVVIMLLMSRTGRAALVGLTGAFAMGSSRSVKTSIYVVALVVAALLYIGLQVLVFFCEPVVNWVHNIQDMLQRYLRLDQIEPQDPRVHAVHIPQETVEADQLLKKSRMYLLLLGILAASITYQAGLNLAGGFWQSKAADGVHHYLAGDPVLHTLAEPASGHPRLVVVLTEPIYT